jgi:hypothetical protein
VGYRHELGDSRSAEDGMVGRLEVRDFELDILGTVVVPRFPKGNWQDHLAQWNSRVPGDDAVEGRGALSEHVRDVEGPSSSRI